MMKPQHEIIKQGYDILIQSLGVTDTIRFIQYFSPGQGDYTKERHQWLGQTPLEQVLTQMKQILETDPNQYEEIIE